MRGRWLAAAGWLTVFASAVSGGSQQPAKVAQCRVGTLEGQVRAGEPLVRPIGGGLEIMLEPLASGWILRVLPSGKARPPHDYAELATPPYHSVSALLVSTDFSFRSQDAIGWNPRRFRFAADEASFARLLKAYAQYEAKGGPSPASQENLASLVAKAPEGIMTILDAHLVPGTGDQTSAAAVVASHFIATAHTIEAPADGKPTVLGRISWMRFRIALEIPQGFKADRSLNVKPETCRLP